MTDGRQIKFNGEQRAVRASTVGQLLEELDLEGKKVAVELNREIVPRTSFATTALSDGDAVEIVHFVGGG